MRNFLEATATRVQLKIALDLRPIGNPCVRVSLGENVLLDGSMSMPLHLEYSHDLLKPLRFTLELSNKEYSQEHETAVIVERFFVDNVPGGPPPR